MDVRLVAYRPATSSDSVDSAFELELNEAPNISLNYQFSDIKEPEARKGGYSQTFKLPFTNKNNEFFQNWYNVNLETLVFSTTKKFNAIIYIGSTPQFDGILQLKAVYKKAEQYEVVVMANTADLFAEIGDKKVVEAIGNELDHTFSYNNIKLSWDGSTSSFVNVPDGTSLRDTEAGVQKVVYPITASEVNKFYFGEGSTNGSGTHLNMNQTALNALGSYTQAVENITSLEQLKPAVQLKAILKLIIARAGFSYTSDFIDGSYFGKIFMTTCNTLDSVTPPVAVSNDFVGGELDANADWSGSSSAWPPSGNVLVLDAYEWVDVYNFTATSDVENCLQADGQTFEIVSPAQTQITIDNFNLRTDKTTEPAGMVVRIIPVENGVPQYESDGIITSEPVSLSWFASSATISIASAGPFTFNLENFTVGSQFRFQVCVTEAVNTTGYQETCTFYFDFGGGGVDVTSYWPAYSTPIVGNTIGIKACVDPDLTQRDFLKDILERFNMVIVADPGDPTKLLIEPYVDYLKSGTIKDWTKKLDLSKEIIVKDTSTLQKKVVNLSDLEDVDLLNKLTAEFNPRENVWGKYYQTNASNQFATGELTNNPVFSPFRVEAVYKDSSGELNAQAPTNLAVHYVFSTENTPDGSVDVLKNTKPKIFYYRGSPTTLSKDDPSDTVSIFMHSIDASTVPETRTAFEFTQYPVCTNYDIDTDGSTNDYTISSANKSLFWGYVPPDAPDLNIFNFTGANINSTWELNTLYGLYWASYLNATYSADARLMECYLNLNEVDIYNFKFSDEIFIKDCYWRILNIENYQVGDKVSTKVVLLKAIDTLATLGSDLVDLGAECEYLPTNANDNLWLGQFYLWCPEDTPGCTPSIAAPTYTGSYANASCCNNLPNAEIDYSLNYEVLWETYPALNNLVVCKQSQGNSGNSYSMPIIMNNNTALSILSRPSLTSYFQAKSSKNFIRGSANKKYSKLMIPQAADDLGIKYVSKFHRMPQVNGESHRLVMLGNTINIATSESYIQGDNKNMSIQIPTSSNMMIQVMGMSTIVSSTNATYGVGVTEQFVYYTAFRNLDGTVTQIGTALGKRQISQVEGGSANSFLEITSADDSITNGKKLQINVKSTEDNTTKVFTLDVRITTQRIDSFYFNANWALYQNGQRIQFEDNNFLEWN
mgnify:CR=1 FL=1